MRLSTSIWRRMTGKSALVGITIFFAVLAFAVTGVTGSMQDGLDGNVAAQIGDQTISLRTLQSELQRQNRRDANDEAQRQANIQNALNSLIQTKVVIEQANRIGWGANDMEVAQWIRSEPSFRDEDTKRFDKKRYDDFIKSGRISELDLFQQGRDIVASQKYANLLSLDSYLPDALVREYATRNAISFTLEFFEIRPPAQDVLARTEERAKEYAEDPEHLEDLQADYDSRKEEFDRPARTKISTLLIAHAEAEQAQGEAAERTREDAKKLAEELLSKAQAGEDFAALAAQTNDDLTARATQGDLGFVTENSLDPESFAASQELTSDGQLSAILDTPFGFRILKRTGFQPAVSQSFEDVKLSLARRAVRNDVENEMKEALRKEVEEALAAGSDSLEALLAEKSISWQKIAEPVTAESRFIAELGMAGPILEKVFALQEKGDVSEILSTSGKTVVLRLLERKTEEVDDARMKSTRDLLNNQMRQQFATEARRSLYDMYSTQGEIKRNANLFRPVQ